MSTKKTKRTKLPKKTSPNVLRSTIKKSSRHSKVLESFIIKTGTISIKTRKTATKDSPTPKDRKKSRKLIKKISKKIESTPLKNTRFL